jgi:trans-2-enoyl-CoA reductase
METKINTIDRVLNEDDLADVCKTVHYSFVKNEIVGEGDDAITYSASNIGTVGLDAPDSENFTAYADITEEDVQGWVEAKIGVDRLAQIEAGLDAQIAEQKTPTKATGLPW